MKKILVYTTSTWPYCGMVKDYLKGKNVEFEEKDIMVDAEARKELMKKGLRGVPVISIEGYKDIVGFDKQKLEQILG